MHVLINEWEFFHKLYICQIITLHFKYITILFTNYTSVNWKKKNSNSRAWVEPHQMYQTCLKMMKQTWRE